MTEDLSTTDPANPQETEEESAVKIPSPAAGDDLVSILLDQKVINEKQADSVRRRMRRSGTSDCQALIELGVAPQRAIFTALSSKTGYPLVELTKVKPSEDATKMVSAKVAMHYRFVPLSLERGTLRAVFAMAPAMRDLENLRLLLGVRIEPCLATSYEVTQTLKSVYGLGAETVLQIQEEKGEAFRTKRLTTDLQQAALDAQDDTAPIISLVNQLLMEALEMNATDIHIEPFHDHIKVRYRVDGMLRDVPVPQAISGLHEAIVSRIKIMADLNIAERRLPHDGRIRVNVGDESFDLRVSIIPTRFGETICLRILNRSSIFLNMSELGLDDREARILSKLIDLPHGIVLVTGPTGSGKTTTLYAALAQIVENNPERKIITVEDPVEYELKGTSQIQTKSEIGLTFASGLRSILRHDPDIVLIGEIRDEETAEIAIRSALTGHLVFSTLHTNDSTSSVNRLVDMEVEPYLVSSSLVAALAQRLVRRICPNCKREVSDISQRLREEIAEANNIKPEEVRAWEGAGCEECGFGGYRGRVAIYEFFLLDEEIHDMVSARATTSELRREAIRRGMRTLRDSGWAKVIAGRTTIDEVSRITGNFQVGYEMGDAD